MIKKTIIPKKGFEDLHEMVTDKKNALEDEIRREFAERGKNLDNIKIY